MSSAKVHGEHGSPQHHMLSTSLRRESMKGGTLNEINFNHFLQNVVSAEDQGASVTFTLLYERIRLQVKFIVQSTWYGMLYKRAMLAASVTSVLLYILETYFDKESNPDVYILLSTIDVATALLFAIDWSLSIFLADQKMETMLGFNAMIDLVIVLTVLLSNFLFTEKISYQMISTGTDLFIYLLYCCQTSRILRIIRLHKEFEAIDDKVNRFLAQLTLAFVTMLLFDAALLQYLESHVQQLDFHDWTYMMTVTMTTVGYGDILPHSTLGRFSVMGIIYFAIVFVPMQTNELIEMMNRQSVYARAKYKSRGLAQHVIVCGDLESTSLVEFFRELFHEDHENIDLHAVILQPEAPSYEVRQILSDPVFSLVVHYIEGSPLLGSDLRRAKAETAVAIFLLSDKFCVDADAEDTKTILQQLSIQRFMLSSGTNTDIKFCMQLLRPENKKHLGDIEENDQKLVVCLNQMKMGALAKACLFPGVNTLIFNLLSSFAEDEDPLADNNASSKFDPDATEEDELGTWLEEYEKGCGWEIYLTELADAFEGKKFVDLAYSLYDRFGIVLFALKIKELKGRQHIRVLLNPADFVIPKKDEYEIQGFVVAENQGQSDLRFAADGDSGSSLGNPFHLLQSLANLGGMNIGGVANGRRESIASSGSGTDSRRGSQVKKEVSTRWQDVKAEYDAHRELQVGNAQEHMSKQEAEYIQNNYFVRHKRLSLEEATIETSVLDEVPNVNQHIIIIGKGLNSLYDFIRPWRAKYLGRLRHIVILSPNDIKESIWRRVSIFEGILFVKGSSLEESDLMRAGIFKAAQVVVLADGVRKEKKANAASNSSDALEDADAIFCYQLVKRLNEKAHVVVEIVHSSNVGYLDTHTNGDNLVRAEDYKFTPQFAAGTLYTSSLLDTVLCQTFYNPQIIRVVDKLISGTDHKPNEATEDEDNVTKKKKKKHSNVNSRIFDGMGSSLHQIFIPNNLKKQTYGELFRVLSAKGIIPLGLLRGTFPAMNIGPKGNKLPYVYTNPSKDTEVFSCDKVFVLSQNSLNTTKFTADEIQENFLKQTETAILTKSAEKDSELDIITRPKTAIQKEMDRFFSAISGEVQHLSSVVNELSGTALKSAPPLTGVGSMAALGRRRAAMTRIKPPSMIGTITPKGTSRKTIDASRPNSSGNGSFRNNKPSTRRTGVSSGVSSYSNIRRPRAVSMDTNGTVSSTDED